MSSNSSASYAALYAAVRGGNDAAYSAIMSSMSDEISEWQISDRFVSSVYIHTSLGAFENFTHVKRQDVSFPDSVLYEKFEEDPNLFVAWYPAMSSPIFRDPETVIPVVYKVRMSGGG